jgi:hypothetical protein
MQNPQTNKKLKQLDLTQKEFEANGKKYFIESSLSFERYLQYQKLQIELAFEPGFYGVFEAMKKGYELCNNQKFADLAVLLHNTMAGIATVDQRRIPALDLCALFINKEDEDRAIINDDMIKQKINDWQAEGLDILPFFQLAMDSIKDFRKIYSALILSSLEN